MSAGSHRGGARSGSRAFGPFPLSPEAFGARWRDWRWQLRHRTDALDAWMNGPGARHFAAEARAVSGQYPASVTPYYLSLIRRPRPDDPIALLCIPHPAERDDIPGLSADPFGERESGFASGILRRYRDRALVVASRDCAVRCRHCTRKNYPPGEAVSWTGERLRALRDWFARRPEIREALISGGDPLLLSTGELRRLLETLRAVPSVEILRVGTRVPVTLPQRVTTALCRALRGAHPVWLNTHFNHPAELTPEAAAACARLADAGLPLGNQTVLLRGVNDRAGTLETLFRGLLRMRVRPYYLLQCDPVRGTAHFRVPLSRAVEIMRELRGRLGGMGLPRLAVDIADAGGKIPILPDTVAGRRGGTWRLRTASGRVVDYPDSLSPSVPGAAVHSSGGGARKAARISGSSGRLSSA